LNFGTHLVALKIHKIVADLEKYPNQIHESYIVAKVGKVVDERCNKKRVNAHTSTFVVEQAIMSLIPIRRRPPVSETCLGKSTIGEVDFRQSILLLTIIMYSYSDGHRKESRHKISSPCPR
jgi:hypothetical protein